MIEVKNKEYIPEIIEMANKIKIWDFDLEELRVYLETYIGHPSLLVLYEKDKAFSISCIYRDLIIPYVVILYAYIDPHYPKIGYEMLNRIKQWAKEKSIEIIRICIRKGIKAFKRKYGFKPEGILMKLEV